jgi:hypothetical protein
MEDARYFRAKAARCLRIAELLSDKRAAENLRAVAADSFSRAAEMETGAQPKINGSVVQASSLGTRNRWRLIDGATSIF